MDVGHLAYAIRLPVGAGGGYCPQSAYNALDSNLTSVAYNINGNVPVGTALADTGADQPASPGNTLSVTLDITRCYAAIGPAGASVGQVQLWTWAIPNTIPSAAQHLDAHAEITFRLAP